MSVNLITPNIASDIGTGTSSKKPDKAALEKAARQFEAFVLTKMLQSARENNPGGLMGDGGDQASNTISGMAEEHFAQALAAKGGLGLAQMVTKGLIAAESNGKSNR